MNNQETQGSSLYGGYLKTVQRYYERDPIVRASLQLILSIFTVAFFVFLAIRPTLSTITTLIKKIDDQKIADQKLSTKMTQLAQAQEFLLSQGETLASLSKKAIPEVPEVKRIAQEMELLANQNGVLIGSLDFQGTPLVGNEASLTETNKGKVGKNEQFVLFSFTVAGEQTKLINFLTAIEKTDRAMTVTNLIFSKPQRSTKISLPLTVTGKATAYYLPAPQAAQAGGQAIKN